MLRFYVYPRSTVIRINTSLVCLNGLHLSIYSITEKFQLLNNSASLIRHPHSITYSKSHDGHKHFSVIGHVYPMIISFLYC